MGVACVNLVFVSEMMLEASSLRNWVNWSVLFLANAQPGLPLIAASVPDAANITWDMANGDQVRNCE